MCSVAACTPLLIQKNVKGSEFFNRSWAEYRTGFGDPSGKYYWIGNYLLSWLTMNGDFKLKFDLQKRTNGMWYHAEYCTFRVLSEKYNYQLLVAGYSGDAGDSMAYHNGAMFSTYDRDNDLAKETNFNCAAFFGGGFWHRGCYESGVNSGLDNDGFVWHGLPDGIDMRMSHMRMSRMWLLCK